MGATVSADGLRAIQMTPFGFTRVLTDCTYLAMVLEVVVSDDFRDSSA